MRKLMRVLAVALAAATVIAAFDGGGGSGSIATGNLGRPQQPQGATVTLQTVTNGRTAARVAEYLRVHASGRPWQSGPDYTLSAPPGLAHFATPPVVRIADTSTARERAQIAYAVALSNRALPYDKHLTFGPDAPADMYRDGDWERGLPGVPDGVLFVKFIDANPQGGRPGSEALGHRHTITEYDALQRRWEKKRLRAAAVEMNRDAFQSRPERQAISVLVHEMLHGLGFAGHPACGSYSDSNMCNSWFRLDGSLPAIDAAAVQVLCTRLDEDTEPEDVSPTSFGPWSRQAVSLSGRFGDGLAFGVRHANGNTGPWTMGAEPNGAFRDNRALSGRAIWRGELVGFTPVLRSVRGNAEIGVDVATMTGTAGFTALQLWAAGQAPRASGAGSQWGEGDLRYSIAVGGNFLYSTGGDAGTVNGRFVGSRHEGVVGTLERSDLTAGFGGQRQ